MQSIAESHFLQSLAYALLSSMWQMGLLWFAVVCINVIFKLSSAQKFSVALIAQCTGFILFLFCLTGDASTKNFVLHSPVIYISRTSGFLQPFMPLMAALYIIVLCWHITKLVFNYRFAQHLRKDNLMKMPVMNRVFVDELTAAFTLKKKIKIYLSKNIRCPLTVGFIKPVILIPIAAINHLSKEQMEAVIVHELAHIKRADYLINLIQCCIEKIFFFNIFSKLLSNIIERERENACDDWVLQFKYNSFHYAEALIKLGKLQTSYSLAMAVSGKKESLLFLRIKRLIHGSEKKSLYRFNLWQFGFLGLMLTACLLFSFSIKTKNNMPVSRHNKLITAKPVINNQKNESAVSTSAIQIQKPSLMKKIDTKNIVAKNQLSKKFQKNNINYIDVVKLGNSNYITQVNQLVDSVAQPAYAAAIDSKLLLNTANYKKVISYQNFKRLETMLALTGDSINVYEDPSSTDSYKKLITMETTDKKGNKNIYQVQVELYQ